MLLSTQTDIFEARLGGENGIRALCEAGFDALDYSMFSIQNGSHPINTIGYEYIEKLKKIASEYGVIFNQAHAPFPSYRENNEEYNKKAYELILKSMEICSILEVKTIVVHPTYITNTALMKQFNIDLYNSFIPYCQKYNVKIALENMWGWDSVSKRIIPNVCSTAESLAEYLDSLDRKYFTVCLDLGHCGLVGEDTANMIRVLGHDRLKAIHVHDNDNINDSHTAPFYGKMDWDAITRALSYIDYDGEFTFEADQFYKDIPNELLPSAAKYLHDIGRQLIKMTEG